MGKSLPCSAGAVQSPEKLKRDGLFQLVHIQTVQERLALLSVTSPQ